MTSGDLTGKTLGIVGLGGIGEATARVGRAFGMRVVAMRRTPVESPNVDLLLPPDRLSELVTQSDYVVLCLPHTNETHHLIGPEQLEAMGPSTVLINVARGDIVHESALIEALRTHTIRGATLDVVSQEPLPADSPLWALENCIITPHDSGWSPRANERLAALFLDNLGRYVRGELLRNEIRQTK